MESNLKYYWVNDKKLLAKMENDIPFIFKNGVWSEDTDYIVKDRLIGYVPGEGIGNTDMLDAIDEISLEEAERYMRG